MINLTPWNKKSVINSALDEWLQKGLIGRELGETLRAETNKQVETGSFSNIAILLGIICLGFGTMSFVAANWEVMSSLHKVGVLFAGLWISWLASIFFKARQKNWLAEVFVLLACSMFGASIMLIGQIYHIQGDTKDSIWMWAIGTIGAALVSRSIPALSLGVILISIWSLWRFEAPGSEPYLEYMYLVYWSICALGAWWLSSKFAGHLLVLGLGAWLFLMSFKQLDSGDGSKMLLTLSICGAFFLMGFTLVSMERKNWLKGFEVTLLRYLAAFIGIMLSIWNFGFLDNFNPKLLSLAPNNFVLIFFGIALIGWTILVQRMKLEHFRESITNTLFAFAGLLIFLTEIASVQFLPEAYLLAFSIWVIRMGSRLQYRSISALGFGGFAALILIIYLNTIGTLLDTSIFYLLAGGILLGGSLFVPLFMKISSQKGELR